MALTGATFGDTCYESQAVARDAYYSSVASAVVPGATGYVIQFEKTVGGVWQQKSYSIASNGAWTLRSTTNAPVITFPTCDPSEPFFDGMAIGWGVVLAMVSVAAVMMMRRGARGG
jgi:hypothetical protein